MREATYQLISSHTLRQVSNVTPNERSDKSTDIIPHFEAVSEVTPNEISDKPIDIITHIDAGI